MSRRMFDTTITSTDQFLDMPTGSQLLYFHLGMHADDDGFVASPRSVMRMVGANEDELKMLFAKKFVLGFESGVCVIKHWRINNYVRKQIYKPTKYTREKAQLYIRANGAYTLDPTDAVELPEGHFTLENIANCTSTSRRRNVDLGKVRLGKDSIDSSKATKVRFEQRDMRLAELLRDLIAANYPNWQPPKTLDKWAEDINKIIRLDNRTEQQVEYVIRWVQRNDFWAKNILSGSKLRKQFNRLVVEITNGQAQGASKVAF